MIFFRDLRLLSVSSRNFLIGREVDNGFGQNPHKHCIFKASAHGFLNKNKEKLP